MYYNAWSFTLHIQIYRVGLVGKGVIIIMLWMVHYANTRLHKFSDVYMWQDTPHICVD